MSVIVQDIRPKVVNAGGTIRMSGFGFDGSCSVLFGSKNALITDYADEWLEFEAPKTKGSYTLRLVQGDDEILRQPISVTDVEDAATWNLPVRDQDDFRNALLGLMPRGFAWHLGNGGNWWKLFSAFAMGFLEIYRSFRDLVAELSPFKTTSFSTWEQELGLPISGLEQKTAAGRKNEILRIARKKGGCTVPYLKSLLNLYGAKYDLYEYWKDPSVFPSWVASREGEKAKFYVLIKVYVDEYSDNGFNCNSPCNASLGDSSDKILEAIIDAAKPAHVKIIYRYIVRILTDMNGTPIVPSEDDQRLIIV